jgi:formylglycine-generating enzyme required for sulfatase activity
MRTWVAFALLASCGGASSSGSSGASGPSGPAENLYRGGEASLARAAEQVMLAIPAGTYIAGSTPEEREQAYDDYARTAGHQSARAGRWFSREQDRHTATLPAYRIDLMPVTQAAYAEFVADTGRTPPAIDEAAWRAQKFSQDYATQVARFNWIDARPPSDRMDHPVVLVTWADADAYCRWRGAAIGAPRRLPTADEFEKAARGDHGIVYPWGNDFDPERLNSAVGGPRDTVAVGSFPSGASPYGMLDAAGNVFQWTSTPWPHDRGDMTVKGSAWDDHAGVGRGAAMHGRAPDIHHAIVGFRCAGDP